MDVSSIQKGVRIKDPEKRTHSFLFEDGTMYRVHKHLGSGTFGRTYDVVGPDSVHYALKRIQGDDIYEILKECVIHIVLAETSKHEPNGPYVPQFFRFACDFPRGEAYIVTERMEHTFLDLLQSEEANLLDTIVPDCIQQISTSLQFFGKHLQFNHRDLKPDNIMCIRKGGNYVFKLIDFGYSCLTWKGLHIVTRGPFATCFRKDRDMSQLLYAIYTISGRNLSKELRDRIYSMLTANIGAKHTKCSIPYGCQHEGLVQWKNSYDFFDRTNVCVPSATIYTAKKHMENFAQGKPFQPSQTFRQFQTSVNMFSANMKGKESIPASPRRVVPNRGRLHRVTAKLNTRLIPRNTLKQRKRV